MSLLEVLIAMGILTVGILGVAALIPTGQFAVVESTKADRSSACGRAGLAEVKARRMLNSGIWAAYAPSASPADWYPFAQTNTPEVYADIDYGDAFVIDPWFVANNYADAQSAGIVGHLAAFPYGNADPLSLPLPWQPAYLDRLTYINSESGVPPVLPLSVARRIFGWADDLLFEIARGDPDQRTRAIYAWVDTTSGNPIGVEAYPPAPAGAVPLRQENEGNYSWMLTVSPAATEIDAGGSFSGRKYRVSVVVFFRRDLAYRPLGTGSPVSADEMPTERPANVLLTAGGYGGGDATIYLPTAMGGSADFGLSDPDEYDAYLKVKKDTWILLMGMQPDARLPDDRFGTPPPTNWRRVAQWYRVVMADEVQEGTVSGENAYYRRVTLAGPDWDPSITPTAVLVDGVIGVYTKTIEVD